MEAPHGRIAADLPRVGNESEAVLADNRDSVRPAFECRTTRLLKAAVAISMVISSTGET